MAEEDFRKFLMSIPDEHFYELVPPENPLKKKLWENKPDQGVNNAVNQ